MKCPTCRKTYVDVDAKGLSEDLHCPNCGAVMLKASRQAVQFPYLIRTCIHGSDETGAEIADAMFKQGTEAHGLASHCLDEYQIVLEFQEDGSCAVVEIDGLAVPSKTGSTQRAQCVPASIPIKTV